MKAKNKKMELLDFVKLALVLVFLPGLTIGMFEVGRELGRALASLF